MRIPIRWRLAGPVLLAAALALPGTGVAAAAQDDSIVLEAEYRPYWKIVPPSTDPHPPMGAVQGFQALRGTVVHGEGDLVLLDLGFGHAVVRLPMGGPTRIMGSMVPWGSAVEAIGPTDGDGIMDAIRVVIDPA